MWQRLRCSIHIECNTMIGIDNWSRKVNCFAIICFKFVLIHFIHTTGRFGSHLRYNWGCEPRNYGDK